ncbi:hypothetical protein QTA56_12065 [Acinetobacter sp. VNH17]|uniref:Transposase n=1 Tax=Acinetobacter thutiue TaxID=2998078 RepID=A0ABT7WQX5_9GAMM|nr:hypothetical protein [Acinetobacter thutiue]MCY6412852.1 hypothetical protein [Acinetobacter thutiue]MDN0014959.1 hypothetical protein [Acinetobacter thutiue]
MSIPAEIYLYLNLAYEKGERVSVESIRYRFKKSKSSAYTYLREFRYHKFPKKVENKENSYIKIDIKQRNRKNVSTEEFEIFMFNVLENGGFKSTRHLFLLFIQEFICRKDEKEKINSVLDHFINKRKLSDKISLDIYSSKKRTFNRYFSKFRGDQKNRLAKHKLRISKSRTDTLRGYYTVKRKNPPPRTTRT